MQEPLNVCERMKRDWNERAREDAHFYVAFGRRHQDNDEFFATASEIVRSFETELRRLPLNANRREWRVTLSAGPDSRRFAGWLLNQGLLSCAEHDG